MRFVTFLLAIAACAGVVYNHLQLRDIRQQVANIQTRLAREQSSAEPAGIVAARRHLERALELISSGKLEAARTELEQGNKAIAESASRDGKAQPTLDRLQQMVDSAREELARFWSGKQEAKP